MIEKDKNIVEDMTLDQIIGGYAGSDKYTQEQYSEAGIGHQHSLGAKDKYFFKGKIITQKEAELYTAQYFLDPPGFNTIHHPGRKPTIRIE